MHVNGKERVTPNPRKTQAPCCCGHQHSKHPEPRSRTARRSSPRGRTTGLQAGRSTSASPQAPRTPCSLTAQAAGDHRHNTHPRQLHSSGTGVQLQNTRWDKEGEGPKNTKYEVDSNLTTTLLPSLLVLDEIIYIGGSLPA